MSYADKLNCVKCRPSIGYVHPHIFNQRFKNQPPILGNIWMDIHFETGWGWTKASRLVSPKQLCRECYVARVEELESKMIADMEKEMNIRNSMEVE